MGSNQSLPTPSSSSSGNQRRHENETGGGGEVRIDINPDHHSRQIITERGDRRRRSSSFDRAMKMMIDMTLAIGGQTIGAVALTSCGSGGGGSLYFVELSIVFGLSFIFAAISLRSKLPDVSTVMAKLGAIVIAVAIIFSVTSQLPPILAFTAGPFALLIVSVAVAFAFASSD